MKTFLTRAAGVTACSFILASVTFAQKEEPTPKPPPPIIYTGKLMGYFRSPSLQASTQTRCPSLEQARYGATAHEKASRAAGLVVASDSKVPEGAILVGTGDNFAPQLEARTFDPAPLPASSGAPDDRLSPPNKELYSWYREGNRWIHYQKTHEIDLLHRRLLAGTNTIPNDNVACFLAAAGYSAVVPGKHDFYFGPERLRQLARFMADKNLTGFNTVQMLGANLVIKTSLIKPPEIAPDEKKWGWPKEFPVLNVADGNEVYPWLSHARVVLTEFTPNSKVPIRLRALVDREVSTETQLRDALRLLDRSEVEADQKAITALIDRLDALSKLDAYVCPADKGRDDIKVADSCRLDPRNRTFRVTDNAVVEDFGFDLHGDDRSVFDPAKNYGLVLQSNSSMKPCDDKEVSCIRFRSRRPFFHFNDSTPDHNHDPSSYVFIEEKNAVIFGVVDQALGEQVGVLNFSWKNLNDGTNTAVSVEDPVDALQTQLDFFNRTHPKFNGVKILLAQMGAEHARALGIHFPEFQVVVTAADGERSTSELDFSTTWAEGPHAKAFIAIPAPYFDPQQRDRYEGIVHLGRIEISHVEFKQEKYVRNLDKPAAWLLKSHRIEPQEVPLSKPKYDARTSLTDSTKTEDQQSAKTDSFEPQNAYSISPAKLTLATNALPAPDASRSFLESIDARLKQCQEKIEPDDYFKKIQLLTLCLMRERLSADVALIQKRDFFNEFPEPDLSEPAHFQEALDRILWKGDLLSLLYVPGAALKKALDQSKKFDDEDSNTLSLAGQKARGLQFIGVHFNSKTKQYVINEMPLDDKKIYAVATTDYLGAGDTGYPDVASAALNPKNRADKFPAELTPISSLVCRGLFADPHSRLRHCLADLMTANYLDETNATVEKAGDPPTFGSKVAKFFKPTSYTWSDPVSLEDRVQRRTIWVLSLKNLGLTFSGLSNNMSDDELSETFGGVPIGSVTSGKAHTLATNLDLKLSRSSHDYEFFLGTKVDYKVQSTGDINPQIDQLSNRLTAETGIARSLAGGRGPARLSAVFTFHAEMPVAKPFTVFKLGNGDPLKIIQSRNLLLLPRIGMRWQSDTNYFEAGGQAGWEYRALGGYRFNTTSEVCLPDAGETFADCITRLSKTTPPAITKDTGATPILERRRRTGLYWNAGLTIPFGEKIKYQFTDEGNFFFNSKGDNATDTRRWDKQTHTLKFSIFSSLSIGPSLQLIFFKNKVNRDFLFQKQFGIETSFAFDWFNKREKGVQVQHKP